MKKRGPSTNHSTISNTLEMVVLALSTSNCSAIRLPLGRINWESTQNKQQCVGLGYCFPREDHNLQQRQQGHCHLKRPGYTQMVIRPESRNSSAKQKIDVSIGKAFRKWQVCNKTRGAINGDQGRCFEKPSGCSLWVFNIHPMGKFAPMIDWKVFQIRAALGMKCWLAVMRQSGFSPWSRQKMLWHNLAAGLTEDRKSVWGQKVDSFYWYEQQHKWTCRACMLRAYSRRCFYQLY